MLRQLLCGLACVLVLAQPARADTLYYPAPETRDDARAGYGFALLQLALKKAGSPHTAALSPVPMQQNRAIAELMAGSGKLHVLSTMTTVERERQLLPVRIPSRAACWAGASPCCAPTGANCSTACRASTACAPCVAPRATTGPTSPSCALPA